MMKGNIGLFSWPSMITGFLNTKQNLKHFSGTEEEQGRKESSAHHSSEYSSCLILHKMEVFTPRLFSFGRARLQWNVGT